MYFLRSQALYSTEVGMGQTKALTVNPFSVLRNGIYCQVKAESKGVCYYHTHT